MSNLFWLLASSGGGSRYLSLLLRFSMGLSAQTRMEPPTDTAAELTVRHQELTAAGAVEQARDMALEAGPELGLTANLVFWLVNDAAADLEQLAELTAEPEVSPPIRAAGEYTNPIPLTAGPEVNPPVPVAGEYTERLLLTAEPEINPPIPVAGEYTERLLLTTEAEAGSPTDMAAELTVRSQELTAIGGVGTPTATAAESALPAAELTAKAMCWLAPEWVDESTLYIRFVYSTEQDGDTLILH